MLSPIITKRRDSAKSSAGVLVFACRQRLIPLGGSSRVSRLQSPPVSCQELKSPIAVPSNRIGALEAAASTKMASFPSVSVHSDGTDTSGIDTDSDTGENEAEAVLASPESPLNPISPQTCFAAPSLGSAGQPGVRRLQRNERSSKTSERVVPLVSALFEERVRKHAAEEARLRDLTLKRVERRQLELEVERVDGRRQAKVTPPETARNHKIESTRTMESSEAVNSGARGGKGAPRSGFGNPALKGEAQTLVPEGWTCHYSKRWNKLYYYCKSTRERSWCRPRALKLPLVAPTALTISLSPRHCEGDAATWAPVLSLPTSAPAQQTQRRRRANTPPGSPALNARTGGSQNVLAASNSGPGQHGDGSSASQGSTPVSSLLVPGRIHRQLAAISKKSSATPSGGSHAGGEGRGGGGGEARRTRGEERGSVQVEVEYGSHNGPGDGSGGMGGNGAGGGDDGSWDGPGMEAARSATPTESTEDEGGDDASEEEGVETLGAGEEGPATSDLGHPVNPSLSSPTGSLRATQQYVHQGGQQETPRGSQEQTPPVSETPPETPPASPRGQHRTPVTSDEIQHAVEDDHRNFAGKFWHRQEQRMLADMGKHASPPKLTAVPSPLSVNGVEVKALEARIKELEQLLRLHESRGTEQQSLQNTSRVSRLSPNAAGEEDTDLEAEKVTYKHQRQFSARERLLRESAEEAEAAAEAAEKRLVEDRARLRMVHLARVLVIRHQHRSLLRDACRHFRGRRDLAPSSAAVSLSVPGQRGLEGESSSDDSVGTAREQEIVALRSEVKTLKLQLVALSSKLKEGATDEAEAALRARLEHQFAEELSTNVAREVAEALRQMHGQQSADGLHAEFLRQESKRSSDEAETFKQRLASANALARQMLSDITLCSMEAMLVNIPAIGGAPAYCDPAGSSTSSPPFARASLEDHSCSTSNIGTQEGAAHGQRMAAEYHLGPGPPHDVSVLWEAEAPIRDEAILRQITRRAFAFITGQVDLSTVATALQNLYASASSASMTPVSTPRGQSPGAATFSFSRRTALPVSPVIARALEHLGRCKREYAAEKRQRIAAAVRGKTANAAFPDVDDGLIDTQQVLTHGGAENLAELEGKRLAEEWARVTLASMRTFFPGEGPQQLHSNQLQENSVGANRSPGRTESEVGVGHWQTSGIAPTLTDSDSEEDSSNSDDELRQGIASRFWKTDPLQYSLHEDPLLGRRPAILSPRSPAASHALWAAKAVGERDQGEGEGGVGDESGKANMSARSKAAARLWDQRSVQGPPFTPTQIRQPGQETTSQRLLPPHSPPTKEEVGKRMQEQQEMMMILLEQKQAIELLRHHQGNSSATPAATPRNSSQVPPLQIPVRKVSATAGDKTGGDVGTSESALDCGFPRPFSPDTEVSELGAGNSADVADGKGIVAGFIKDTLSSYLAEGDRQDKSQTIELKKSASSSPSLAPSTPRQKHFYV